MLLQHLIVYKNIIGKPLISTNINFAPILGNFSITEFSVGDPQ